MKLWRDCLVMCQLDSAGIILIETTNIFFHENKYQIVFCHAQPRLFMLIVGRNIHVKKPGNKYEIVVHPVTLVWIWCTILWKNMNIYDSLTHWGRVTHICVGKLTMIGSDNGLSPGRRQVIIWINAGLLSIGPLGTNFNENLIKMQNFSFTKMHLKISSVKWRPFCPGGMR